MGAKKVDRFILVKNILGAVAVVHIPVHDQNLAYSMNRLSVPCGHRCMVKDTKAHSLRWSGMMARWAAQAEDPIHVSGEDFISRIHHSTGCPKSHIPGIFTDRSITRA